MTVTEPKAAYPVQQPAVTVEASPPRLAKGGVLRFLRRAPLSAFWGCIAAAIVVCARTDGGLGSATTLLKPACGFTEWPPTRRHGWPARSATAP